jgi:hypothetical protein
VFTCSLNSAISSSVIVSALAITGIKLTFVWSRRLNSMSICFKCRVSNEPPRLEAQGRNSRVSSRLNEVKTSVYAVVNNFHTVNTIFLFQIRIEPRLNILHNGLPAVSCTEDHIATKKLNWVIKRTCHYY